MSAERWKAVVGYEGSYEVSDSGRVRSLDRVTSHGRKISGGPLTPIRHPDGHQQVGLRLAGSHKRAWVHRLVLLAFVGPPSEGAEALHRDGDPGNNSLHNLVWGTRSENVLDQVRHGAHFNASKTHCPSGHPYDEANTYIRPSDLARICRTCNTSHSQNRRSR